MSEAVVLVHGTRTSASQWDLQRPGLRHAGYRVVTPDLPGHGTRRAEPFTLAAATTTILDAVRSAAETVGPAAVHLVGSSLGGMLAIHAAAELCSVAAPASVTPLASLTVCGSAVQPTELTAGLYGRAMTAVDLLPGAARKAGSWRSGRGSGSGGTLSTAPTAPDTPTAEAAPAVLSVLLGRRAVDAYVRGGRAGPEVVAPAMRAVAGLDLRSDLRSIPVPVTILSPRFDQLRWHERSFARAAPRGRVVHLRYGTHLVNLSRPELFTQDLVRVLGSARTTG
ncbi:alpha/beta fold hydrolase [Brachybacterium sp. FME24]|uniref:alpha/beta fold hydrolase n=1 Tax=Brachybacterium sp. FME24 TaxID=2742605 RepID=UPI0018665F6A|nr:alpha/beta hydrolase [Brachybacterium sp. FME24]